MQLNLEHNEVCPYRTSKRRTNKSSPRRLTPVERFRDELQIQGQQRIMEDDRKMLKNNINMELKYML
jgi:hypothetical protein